jgi:hypothetical protein
VQARRGGFQSPQAVVSSINNSVSFVTSEGVSGLPGSGSYYQSLERPYLAWARLVWAGVL